jgi:hypothetical protein
MDKQLTAIQQLIEYLNTDFKWFVDNSPSHGVLPKIIVKATELLETEKKQIVNAFTQGYIEGNQLYLW